MLNKFLKALKELPMSDKTLLGVALFILINYKLAILAAVLVVAYFVYNITKAIGKGEG